MMTSTAMLEHAAFAHDGETADCWISIDNARVAVCGSFSDGTEWREPFGLVSDAECWAEACRAAGVVATRLVVSTEGAVSVEITYASGNVESELLTYMDSAGGWRFIPADLFEAWEAIVDEWSD